MGQDDGGDTGQVHFHFAKVIEDGLRPVAGVEQCSLAINLHHGGKPPLAGKAAGEHGGKDSNGDGLRARRRFLRHYSAGQGAKRGPSRDCRGYIHKPSP